MLRCALVLMLTGAASALVVGPALRTAVPAAPAAAVRMSVLDQAAVSIASTYATTVNTVPALAALEDIWKTESRVVSSEVDVVGSSTTILGLAVVFPVAATIVWLALGRSGD